MADLEKFRNETRAWLEANCPPEMRQPIADEDDRCWGGRNATFKSEAQRLWLERDGGARLDRAGLAEGIRRRRPLARGSKSPAREMRRIGARSPLISFGISMLGPALLQYGSEEQKQRIPAADRARRDPLVPGLFRAGRRLRPRVAADARRGQGRPLAGQRPEDLDQLRRQGRLDLLPGAHRSGGVEASAASASSCSTWRRPASRPSRSC